jgi:hypothetical protein
MDGLIEGRIVHYVMPNGKHVPAVITAVWNENGLVNLQAITDGSNSLPYSQPEKELFENFGIDLEQVKHGHIWRTSRSYSEDPKADTWHWIERVEPNGDIQSPVGSVG